jgi:hypothetical protein
MAKKAKKAKKAKSARRYPGVRPPPRKTRKVAKKKK